MLQLKKGVDTPRLPVAKTLANPPASKGGKPTAPVAPTPNPNRSAGPAADALRTAPKASPASAPSGPASAKSPGKSKTSGPSGSEKSSARRDAHIGHATVAPAGRERGSGGGGFGGSRGHGQPDIQDWMPFSAQQSRITRTPRGYPPVGLTKVIAHPVHPIKAVIFLMASHFYSEVLPSLFRRTPQEMDRNNREIRKDALRKELKHKSERNEARREAIRKRADVGGPRVMAGDLTSAFASK